MAGTLRRLLFFLLCSCFISGCSESSSSSSAGEAPLFPTQEIPGVWLGYFIGEDTSNFAVGIITEDHEARFVGSNIQYAGPERALGVTANSSVFYGNLGEYSWTESASDYNATVRSLEIGGWVATRALFWGTYRYNDTQETGAIYFYYNTTYEVSPNVRNLAGDWVAGDVFEEGNTLTLTVIPDPDIENTTSGTISGGDGLGNSFNGDIVIHYRAENVYDVTLSFNGDELTGLATYVLEMTTEGIDISKKTLALGVSNADLTRMISVLSTLGD